ncbi:adenine deaminase [soil metagenome]
MTQISGNIIDIINNRIYKGEVTVSDGIILSVVEKESVDDQYLLPGFIDAHVHIESSMLVPSEFARLAVVHGTVATISDPHEIGNVLGLEGVNYMIENGKQVPFNFFFGAPSCVPATLFETAGAEIGTKEVEELLKREEVKYLAEVMDWPGVLSGNPNIKAKLDLAKKYDKVIDGHAPGLRKQDAANYIAAGITTDHECFTSDEALDKLSFGMKILIREGSAAKNFDALIDLIPEHWQNIMFCSDDKHPDGLEEGHINLLVKRALERNIDLFKVLSVACLNPINHYRLPIGLLRKGDSADFIVIDNLKNFGVKKTFIKGQVVAEKGVTKIPRAINKVINHFKVNKKQSTDFVMTSFGNKIRVIEALDGQLITNSLILPAYEDSGLLHSNVENDILKIAVVNRYVDIWPAMGFIKNIGLKRGAIASSVGHDSHNIVAVGVDDESICRVVNMIIEAKGGVAAFDGTKEMILSLPVAGIMSADDGYQVSKQYKAIDAFAKEIGSQLDSPFMTLSFMALLVIPSLKMSDKGLFDGVNFEFVPVSFYG